MRKMQWNTMLRMTFLFGLFQAGMPFAGWLGSCFFCEQLMSVGSWVAFALLSLIGGKMIKDSFGDDEEEAHFNPRKLHTQLLLAVATSIDALAVGVSLVCLGYTRVPMLALPLWCIGLMSFALGLLGCAFRTLDSQEAQARTLWRHRADHHRTENSAILTLLHYSHV